MSLFFQTTVSSCNKNVLDQYVKKRKEEDREETAKLLIKGAV